MSAKKNTNEELPAGEAASATGDAKVAPKTQGKGRPTPKRREAEARNRRPLVPADRKAAKKAQREARNKEWERQQHAMRVGDDAHMPPQHQGRARRFGRDYVDARWNLAELFFPFAIVLLASMFVMGVWPRTAMIITMAVYVAFIAMMIDSIIMSRRVKKKAIAKFGADQVPGGFAMQMFGRSFYWRRMRLPKPQVKRGEYAKM